MKVYRSSAAAAAELPQGGTAVAIGNFDGVHIGHRTLFARATELAQRDELLPVALTFDPHPARFFTPDLAPPLITTEARKLQLIAESGIAALVIEPFTAEFASLPPERFVTEILVERLRARHVITGKSFVFGRQRAGDHALLASMGRAHGFVAHGLELVRYGGIPVSSSKIREFVLMGRMRGAKALLGREFGVVGHVVTGAGRGRTIGIPTANLQPETELLPGRGVYVGRVALPDGRELEAVVNVGTAPTVRRNERVIIEAHLLDFPGEQLVGQRIRVLFLQRLRDEQRFASIDELVEAIHLDIAAAREILAHDRETGGGVGPDAPGAR